MIILGHPLIPFAPLYYVESINEIKHTPPGSLLWLGGFAQAQALIGHCRTNNLKFALHAASLKEALLANAQEAAYIVVDHAIAGNVQKAADTYLFESRILVPVSDDNELEKVAEAGIDGVLFESAIIVSI